MNILLRSLLFFGLPFAVTGQDMRGQCIGCSDVYRKCELSCVMPSFRPEMAKAWPVSAPELGSDVTSCVTECKRSLSSCQESTEASNCLACVETCSVTYSSEMLECLQALDPTTKMTFSKNLDACSTASSSKMDACVDSCHGDDQYDGWTPEAEEGLPTDGERFSIPKYRAQIQKEDSSAAANFMARDSSEPSPTATLFGGSASLIPHAKSSFYMVGGIAGLAMIIGGFVLERRQYQSI